MKKVYELKNERAEILDAAENALNQGDMEAYNAKMKEPEDLKKDCYS